MSADVTLRFQAGRESHITAQLGDIIPSRHSHTEVLGSISAVCDRTKCRSYHCDGNVGRIRENKSHLVELVAATPVLSKGHPGSRVYQYSSPSSGFKILRHTILDHCWKIRLAGDILLAGADIRVAQAVGHDHRRGVLLQRGNNIGSAGCHYVSDIEVRYLQSVNGREKWALGACWLHYSATEVVRVVHRLRNLLYQRIGCATLVFAALI